MHMLTSSPRPPGGEPVGDTVELDAEVAPATRVRVLLTAAFGPLITEYAVVATLLALVALSAERTAFSATGMLLTAGPGWLAAFQVQLGIAGHPLGVLPLLPTIGAVLLVARTASGVALRLGFTTVRQAVPLICVIATAHALFGLLIGLLSLSAPVWANPLLACVVPGVFAALAATGGAVRRCGLPASVADRLDPLAVRGLRAGALGLAALLAVGAIVFAAATVSSWSTVDDLFEPSFGNSFGLLLLSVAYLPNAVVAALSFVTGPGFTVGSLDVSLIGYRGGAVPAVPLLGGIPEHTASWWPVLLVLPAAVGALVGWSVRHADGDPAGRIRMVAVAGAVVAFGCVVLGTLAGGRLADGPFDPVSVPVGVASIVAFCWIVIPGGFVAFFAGAHEPAAPPEPIEVEDEFAEPGDEDPAEEPGESLESGKESEKSEEDMDEADVDELDPCEVLEDADPEDLDTDEFEAEFTEPEQLDAPEAPAQRQPEQRQPEQRQPEQRQPEQRQPEQRQPEQPEPDYDEYDAEAEAELGLELPEDVALDEPERHSGEPGAVTESTDGSGEDEGRERDR
ncbi:cell division protein PerM [Amycolatopsis sp. NPDC004368]